MHDHGHKPCGFHHVLIENMGVKYGQDAILENINLDVRCGTLTALIGPNGAGKSTLLKAILGEIKHSGVITFKNADEDKTGEMVIGYVPQKLNLERDIPITVYDLFASYVSNWPVWLHRSKRVYDRIYEQLKIFSIEDCIDQQIGKLSGGQLQRVLLSIAITPIPNLLILDEPVSGIDKNGVRDFYQIINGIKHEYDLGVLLVSHDLDLVEKYADNVILLNHKVLCEGAPEAVYCDDRFKEIFG